MLSLLLSALIFKSGVEAAASSQTYSWANVHTGASGGFTPGIVFHPKQKGLAYARTDIGGVYRLNSDDSWTPLTDAVGTNSNWDLWGSDCLAVDPSDATRVYVASGMYTNSWDPNNGAILSSTDQGASWTVNRLSFKVGGNMPGRGLGERLAVDPHDGAILFYGARSGHGLWKSTNYGATWTQVTTFPTVGTYIPDPSDTSGYNSDIIGFSWVTFDSTSGSSGSATPRIFVGVATNTTNNIFVTTDGGTSWSAVAGQNHTFIPHKGVIDTSEGLLYISYSNGAGPYDGTLGFVKKYAIASGTWTDITPVSGSDLYFGFGGLAVDAQKPGTVMVAALNSWWPEASIYRSLDSGTTWSKLWDWQSYPTMNYYFSWSAGSAPWLGVPLGNQDTSREELGWMIEALAIDPFDSNHWLYGTGETIYGSHDLLNWDTKHNVSIISLSNGMEETSVQDLTAPPSGPILVGAMGDVGGFVWTSLTTAPTMAQNWNALTATPLWSTASGVDYAGNNPSIMVRLGADSADTVLQVALSNTGGQSWYQYYGASTGKYGGKIAISADGVGLLWVDSSASVTWSTNTAAFAASSGVPGGAVIASDKRNNTVFYAASGSNVYLSTNYGSSFTAVGTLQGAGTPVKIAVNPFTAGDLFVSTDVGVFHSTNYGKTFTALSGFGQSWAIAVGAPKTSGGTPSLYVSGTYSSVIGIFRTDDYTTVYQIDNAHGFGSLSANPIAADPNVYGRVFVGTNGRGTFYGTISGGSGTTTTTKTSTTSTKSSATTTTTTTQVTTTTTAKTTTTTTKSTTTTTTTTTASGSCATLYGQCGGATGYTGPTCCASGSCVVQNPFYSQCVPS